MCMPAACTHIHRAMSCMLESTHIGGGAKGTAGRISHLAVDLPCREK